MLQMYLVYKLNIYLSQNNIMSKYRITAWATTQIHIWAKEKNS